MFKQLQLCYRRNTTKIQEPMMKYQTSNNLEKSNQDNKIPFPDQINKTIINCQ